MALRILDIPSWDNRHPVFKSLLGFLGTVGLLSLAQVGNGWLDHSLSGLAVGVWIYWAESRRQRQSRSDSNG